MSCKYRIVGWNGKEYLLTDKELYECVIKDSESDYSWITSATELVRVCNDPNFSEEYAHGIKIAILNCFASLELKKEEERISYRKKTDDKAIYSCYNSLVGTEPKAIEARNNYLMSVIKAVRRYHFEFPIHFGPKYVEICNEWVKGKYDENCSKNEINFKKLIKELHNDFDRTIREAENKGIFKDEIVRYRID